MTKHLPWFLTLAACATSPNESPIDEQSLPTADGKSDEPRACGTESCIPLLCGYDCTEQGAQCARGCAATDERAATYVTATVTGAHASTIDTRHTPYMPVFSLDNVLIYGCQLWDFSDGQYDGLEIEVEELVHASFIVDANDPTRHDRKLVAYIDRFTGPGSYRAEALFRARHDAPKFYAADACAIDVQVTATGGIAGTFDCTIPARDGGVAQVAATGEFACGQNSMHPLFVRRVP